MWSIGAFDASLLCSKEENMMPGSLAPKIELTTDERSELQSLIRRRKSAQAAVMRAKIVLLAAKDLTNIEIAEQLGTTRMTVGKWRKKFARDGIQGLFDSPRPGRPRLATDALVEEVITKTLETTPRDSTHWSTRSMAKAVGLSPATISRIWRCFGLKPHREETFTLSTDPRFVDKVRDVVGLYMSPPENAVVLCVDEKTQIQALDRTQPILPMMPGTPSRKTATYHRHGTTSLFAALNVADGKVIAKCHRRHRTKEFIGFLRTIDKSVPQDLDVHIIMDNLATHRTKAAGRWFTKHPRFHAHFTPTYSSWLNLVERWFGFLEQKQIKRGSHRSTRALEKAIKKFVGSTNENPQPFVWTKTADQILDSISRYCSRINETGH